MNLIKRIKNLCIYQAATSVIVAGSIFLMCEHSVAQDIHVDTHNWKAWAWNATCGGFDIKYSPGWHVRMDDSGELGCNGIITHFPAEYRSLAKASKGIIIRFSYSRTSAVAETTTQKIEEKIVKFPERSFFPSTLRCTKNEEVEQNFIFIECYVVRDKKIYVISADIKNDSDYMYSKQVNELLESFNLNN